jgi:predicted nuclease of predicted toxin-antitoxin system
MLRFLVDECVNRSLVGELRQSGFEVVSIQEINPGMKDTDVLTLSAEKKMVLITDDYDYSNLVFLARQPAHRIVMLAPELVNLVGQSAVRGLADRLMAIQADLQGQFTIMEASRLRQRMLPENS